MDPPWSTPIVSFTILHLCLSFPVGASLNDSIPRERTYVQYGSVEEDLRIIETFPSPYLAKTDIASAFRVVPVRPADATSLGFRWRGRAYVDLCLPMGCASSCQIFQSVSDALVWIAQDKFGAGPIVSVLDDFLFVGGSKEECLRSLTGFQAMCLELNIPLRRDKTVLPCRSLTFLGVVLDIESRAGTRSGDRRGQLRRPRRHL